MEIKKYKQFLESKIPTTIELPEDIIKISNAYTNAGKEIFVVVGGAIRDFILGKTPKDWDLVTNALPNESKVILKDFNVSDEQGKNFGVLRVFNVLLYVAGPIGTFAIFLLKFKGKITADQAAEFTTEWVSLIGAFKFITKFTKDNEPKQPEA